MKKSIIITVILAVIAIVTNAQNINISNISGRGSYFSGFSNKNKDVWTVEKLTVTQDGESYSVSYSVYNVRESEYAEVPNDTTRYEYTGTFTKFTKKDGSGYDLKYNNDNGMYYTVSVSENIFNCEKFPERSYHNFVIMIHYQVIGSGFSVHITLTPEQYEAATK